ncbi:MAG: universal stress protein [Candidatus Binatia bacterium]
MAYEMHNTVPGGVMNSKNLLICVDDSSASTRAVQYVGELVDESKAFTVWLFHLLGPLPPELRETSGSENPKGEEMLEKELTRRQELEIEKDISQEAIPILLQARSILTNAGVPAENVRTITSVLVNREDVARDILNSARANDCRTIVVGRASFSWIQEIFRGHLSDQLIHEGHGLCICTVV